MVRQDAACVSIPSCQDAACHEKPLAIDLYCGLGGWTEGLLAEGYRVVGFDIERHEYGDHRYPAQLILQDVLTLHGSQFAGAALIVASPPCQEFSYMAMPWSLAKKRADEYRAGVRDRSQLTVLFDACFRIQREASIAAGRHIPMVVENVKGAQPWVGRARWNYGSYYLWGDVPALMPMTVSARKNAGFRFDGSGRSFRTASVETHVKNPGQNWTRDHNAGKVSPHWNVSALQETAGVKFHASGAAWFDGKPTDKILGHRGPAAYSSKSSLRKQASAMIAKIPLTLARHIARVYCPAMANEKLA